MEFNGNNRWLLVHYRDRAAELRRIAENGCALERKTLFDMAKKYERLAEQLAANIVRAGGEIAPGANS